MATKYVRVAIGAVAAGAQKGDTFVGSFDDDKPRKITGIWSGDTTALIHTQIKVAGTPYVDVDDQVFAHLNQFLDCDVSYGATQQFQLNVVNDSAGALAVGQAVTIRYEV